MTIAEQKLIDEIFSLRNELALARREYVDLFDYNCSAHLIIDNHSCIQSLNFKAALLLGLERNKLLDTLFSNYISSHCKTLFHETIQLLLNVKLNQNCEIEILAKGGKRKIVEVECQLLKNDVIRVCLVDTTPLHILKNNNFELRKSFNLINNLFQDASDALAALDTECNIKVINELFSDLFSKIIASKIAPNMNLIKELEDFPELKFKITQAVKKALDDEKVEILLENSIKKSDVYYCYKLCIHLMFNPDSQKNELIFRIKNLTDFKLEERRQHKQQSEIALSCRISAMREMASALAHEINQPLTVIAAYSRSCVHIMNNKSLNESHKKLKHALEKIASQSEMAGDIIHNMKDLVCEGNFNAEETNINHLIHDTVAIFQYELLEFKLKISLNLVDNLPKIITNKIYIMQVILNLARNSIEALQISNTNNPELIIETTQSEHYIHIHVRDNGPGIPREYQNKILNTYFTTKRKGTGLGLGICRTLVEKHGGKLTFQEDNDRGALFVFTLPIHSLSQNDIR